MSIETEHPLSIAALHILNERWPHALSLNTLKHAAQAILSTTEADQVPGALLKDLLHCYTVKAAEFHTWQADFAVIVSEKPRVSELAVYQLNNNQAVVNQRHETVNLDIMGRELVRILDGTRDRALILKHLRKSVENGSLVLHQNGKPLIEENHIDQSLNQALEQTLQKLAKAALLVR